MKGNAELFAELRPPLTSAAALLEADRCLECGGPYAPAPCTLACPAGVDVPAFVTALADGDPAGAGRVVFAENLLGGTCARVCPVEVLCEGACVLEHEGRRPIAIGALQRAAADAALGGGGALRERAPDTGFAVAVVGAGPAGLACAGELAARGHAVTVYDERHEVGGLARYAIAPYRQLRDPLPAEARVLEELGVEFHLATPLASPAVLAALADEFDAVFLGVGMGADADLRLPGDELTGVWDSLPFIEALKSGNLRHVGRRVVVIGGGNTAIDVARESVRLGADLVTVVYRRTREEMPAYEFEAEEAAEEGVHFQWLAAPVRFVGESRLEGVECIAMTLGEPGPDGRRRPEAVDGGEFLLAADTAVKAVGQQARLELVEWIDGAEFQHGILKVEPLTGRIRGTKFFAGGDVINGGASVVQAVRDGKRAAQAIDEWLRCRT
jgi:dihydropyrimidine dehydrogenase (NAD+) subunit PreT